MTRRRGLIVHQLNHETLMNEVQLAHPDRDLKHARVDAPVYFIETPDLIAVVGTEGVGHQRDAADDTVKILVDHNGYGQLESFPVKVPHVRLCTTSHTLDLADAIRTFGDRLDGNHYLWFSRAYPEGIPS